MIPRVGTYTKLAAKIQDTHRKGLELTLAGPNDCQYLPQKSAGKRSTWVASFCITLLLNPGVKEIWGPPVLGTPGPHISLKIGARGPYFYGKYRDPIVNIGTPHY